MSWWHSNQLSYAPIKKQERDFIFNTVSKQVFVGISYKSTPPILTLFYAILSISGFFTVFRHIWCFLGFLSKNSQNYHFYVFWLKKRENNQFWCFSSKMIKIE